MAKRTCKITILKSLIFIVSVFIIGSFASENTVLQDSLGVKEAKAAPFAVNPTISRGGHVQSAVQKSQSRYSEPQKNAETSGIILVQAPANLVIPNSGTVDWRIRIQDAAVSSGPVVKLGDIAVPAGNIPPNLWRQYADLDLWPAPPEEGRPMNITRPRLQQAVVDTLGKDFAALCLYPQSLIIQRGGVVLKPEDIQRIVQDSLAPYMNSLPGDKSLTDYRLPGYVFLAHKGQKLELDNLDKVSPGRVSLRLIVKEVDGSTIRRMSGSVFFDCWLAVPCAAAPMNRGDILRPEGITFIRKNLAYTNGEVWDGKGGPWVVTRNITLEEPLMISDLSYVPTVRKGSIVTLTYQTANVRVAVKAEALADGVRGEIILVRNVTSRKEVYATVYDGSSVIIDKR